MLRFSSKSFILAATSFCLTGGMVNAQDMCFPQAYRLQPTTVYERQTVQRLRPVTRVEMVEEQVKSYRPVVKTRTEMRDVTVPVNTIETSYKEERFTVWKPITETSYRDETYTETKYVSETSEREEQYTSYRPVTETKYYQQQYAVQRPVTETQMYQKQYTVQRPVTETQMQTRQYTAMRPQTTMVNQTVDVGGYVAQTTTVPGSYGYNVQYQRGLYASPGPLGVFARVRGGNVVTPVYTAPTTQTSYAYRPNYVNQQVAQTTYQQVTQNVQVPVQVQRMQSEVVTQNVPVQTTRMQTEMVTQNVPVQTTRMVPTTMVRKVPYVVQKPVTQTFTRKIPVTKQRWITEERVRKVPVQTSKIRYETRKVATEVKFTEYEEVMQTVRRAVNRQVYECCNESVVVPRQVMKRVPMSYYDAFSPAITRGYSSFSDPIVTSSLPVDSGSSVLTPSPSDVQESLKVPFDEEPKTGLKSYESSTSDNSDTGGGSETADPNPVELNEPAANSDGDLPAPAADPAVLDAGWKIRWNPSFEHSI